MKLSVHGPLSGDVTLTTDDGKDVWEALQEHGIMVEGLELELTLMAGELNRLTLNAFVEDLEVSLPPEIASIKIERGLLQEVTPIPMFLCGGVNHPECQGQAVCCFDRSITPVARPGRIDACLRGLEAAAVEMERRGHFKEAKRIRENAELLRGADWGPEEKATEEPCCSNPGVHYAECESYGQFEGSCECKCHERIDP